MGGPGDIETKEVPLMSPQQQKILSQLLKGSMSAMRGFPLGQAYGGPVESSWQAQPFMGTQRQPVSGRGVPDRRAGNLLKRGQRPGRPDGGIQSNSNLTANLLGGPEANIMTQGMTGNIPKFRGGRRGGG